MNQLRILLVALRMYLSRNSRSKLSLNQWRSWKRSWRNHWSRHKRKSKLRSNWHYNMPKRNSSKRKPRSRSCKLLSSKLITHSSFSMELRLQTTKNSSNLLPTLLLLPPNWQFQSSPGLSNLFWCIYWSVALMHSAPLSFSFQLALVSLSYLVCLLVTSTFITSWK